MKHFYYTIHENNDSQIAELTDSNHNVIYLFSNLPEEMSVFNDLVGLADFLIDNDLANKGDIINFTGRLTWEIK